VTDNSPNKEIVKTETTKPKKVKIFKETKDD